MLPLDSYQSALDQLLRHLATGENIVPIDAGMPSEGSAACDCALMQQIWDAAFGQDSWADRACRLLALGLQVLDQEMALALELPPGRCIVRYACNRQGMLLAGSNLPCDEDLLRGIQHLDTPIQLLEYGDGSKAMLVILRPAEANLGLLVFFGRDQSLLGREEIRLLIMLAEWFEQCISEEQLITCLNTLAMTDTLTGLPNRRAAELRLKHEQERAKVANQGFSLCMCDIDNFKLINDFYGHDTGDEVLRAFSRLFQGMLQEPDWLARWGGEEFLIFLHDPSPAYAQETLERLRAALHEGGFITSLGAIGVTASFGVSAFYPQEGDSLRTLLKADNCLYSAKKGGRDLVIISGVDDDCGVWQAGLLGQALEAQQVRAAWQPFYDLAREMAVGEEAFARIVHEGRQISAADFLAFDESGPLLGMLDHEMSVLSIEHLLSHKEQVQAGWRFFLNVSPRFLLRRDLLQQLYARVLLARQVLDQPVPLVLDIGGQRWPGSEADLADQLAPLCSLGVELSLNDYTTAAASYLYLARLPIRYLKVDAWLIEGAITSTRIRGLARSMVSMAQDLNLVTIAERLETAWQVELAKRLGIDWGQGDYFGAPMLDL